MSAHAVWALEIVSNDQTVDPRARALKSMLNTLGAVHSDVTHGRLYLISGPDSTHLRTAVNDLCLDPVLATARAGDAVSGGEGTF